MPWQYMHAPAAFARQLLLLPAVTLNRHVLVSLLPLQTVRLELPSHDSSLLCCIDATLEGNIARFMNHR